MLEEGVASRAEFERVRAGTRRIPQFAWHREEAARATTAVRRGSAREAEEREAGAMTGGETRGGSDARRRQRSHMRMGTVAIVVGKLGRRNANSTQ